MNSLIVANVPVRTDAEGRYCLNDLHKAAGGEKKHQPSDFLRLISTCALIRELNVTSWNYGDCAMAVQGAYRNSCTPFNIVNDGKNNGTYAAQHLISEIGDLPARRVPGVEVHRKGVSWIHTLPTLARVVSKSLTQAFLLCGVGCGVEKKNAPKGASFLGAWRKG